MYPAMALILFWVSFRNPLMSWCIWTLRSLIAFITSSNKPDGCESVVGPPWGVEDEEGRSLRWWGERSPSICGRSLTFRGERSPSTCGSFFLCHTPSIRTYDNENMDSFKENAFKDSRGNPSRFIPKCCRQVVNHPGFRINLRGVWYNHVVCKYSNDPS